MNLKSNEMKICFGLEVHITIKSKKKLFNWENTYESKKKIIPNLKNSAWELGYLGALPVINPEIIILSIRLALSLKMKINSRLSFDRKIYNYPDLPKGYQITQKKEPFAINGFLPVIWEEKEKKILIKSLHLEEDTAKTIYDNEKIKLDFNRSGNPLIELVTEPIFSKIELILIFIKQLQILLLYLNISEAKMEKGQIRFDLNFSLHSKDYFTPRYEIKNLNSLSNAKKALEYEIQKYKENLILNKKLLISQTLGFDEKKKKTIILREKKNYWFLPEANIPIIKIPNFEIKKAFRKIPILPWDKWKELVKGGIKVSLANLILENFFLFKSIFFFEKNEKKTKKEIESWIIFFLNFLNKFEKEKFFSSKKLEKYREIFFLWKEKKIENKEVIKFIKELIKKGKVKINFFYKKKEEDTSEDLLIFSKLEEIWNINLHNEYLKKPEKISNFLIGKLRKENLIFKDSKKISKITDEFIKKKIREKVSNKDK